MPNSPRLSDRPCVWHPAADGQRLSENRATKRRPGTASQQVGRLSFAGVPGLEPRLTEPESVGLPITLYPIDHTVRKPPSDQPHRAAVVYRIPDARANQTGRG